MLRHGVDMENAYDDADGAGRVRGRGGYFLEFKNIPIVVTQKALAAWQLIRAAIAADPVTAQ
jgi:hypothetical protein